MVSLSPPGMCYLFAVQNRPAAIALEITGLFLFLFSPSKFGLCCNFVHEACYHSNTAAVNGSDAVVFFSLAFIPMGLCFSSMVKASV